MGKFILSLKKIQFFQISMQSIKMFGKKSKYGVTRAHLNMIAFGFFFF